MKLCIVPLIISLSSIWGTSFATSNVQLYNPESRTDAMRMLAPAQVGKSYAYWHHHRHWHRWHPWYHRHWHRWHRHYHYYW